VLLAAGALLAAWGPGSVAWRVALTVTGLAGVGLLLYAARQDEGGETEQELQKLETQLRQAQKLEVVGRLAAGIAHDFNNLLTAIRGNAELILAADGASPETEANLQEIARSADRAAALTRQLLTYAHHSPVETRPIGVNRMVQGLESMLDRLMGETVELRVEPATDAGAVLVDPGQIEQVLMNLVINARDALPGGGRITIRTGSDELAQEDVAALPYTVRPGPYSVITVTDDGTGMDPDTADRVFEPFFTTKPAGVGTGLGLSTVYGIVKQARGHIRLETEPGVGTEFAVYLPRAEPEQTAPSPQRAPSTETGGTETVLVAEDEEAVLSLAQRTLERQGYRVLPAMSGREALGHALKHPGEIHALFCDVVLPDLTGREVAERVREARPGIEVLMTSGYGERQLAEEGVLEERPFLAKPYTPAELTRRVRELLGTPATSVRPSPSGPRRPARRAAPDC
jgi:signal transduction histidine kinase/CheY-like chemotaxis protein